MNPPCSSACLITYGTSRLLSATFFPKRKDKWLNLPCFMFICQWRLWLHNDARLVQDVTGTELDFTVSFLWEPFGVRSMQFHHIDHKNSFWSNFILFPPFMAKYYCLWVISHERILVKNTLLEHLSWWKGIPEIIVSSLSLQLIYSLCMIRRIGMTVE